MMPQILRQVPMARTQPGGAARFAAERTQRVWRKQMRKTPSSMMAILAILMLILAACNGGGESPSASEAESRSEEHTSELQSQSNLVCRLLLEKKNLHVYSE